MAEARRDSGLPAQGAAPEVYRTLGIATVINAAGKLTALGGTAQTAEVAQAAARAAQTHVDIEALRKAAGGYIARLTGAEAASVTTGAAAGIAISVAAVVAGTDPALVHRLPASDGLVNRIILQAGHAINFGAPVEQMIRLGGGRPEIVGWTNNVPETLLGAALKDSAGAAALLYVQSHHSVQERMVTLDRAVALAHGAGVPVIVDAAAEEDLRHYIALGVDLVTYSGGKAFGGPTAGFIAGRADLVAACEAQTRGIARTMKVGKEQIAGLVAALDAYGARDEAVEAARREAVNARLLAALADIPALDAYLAPDEAGRPIERVAVAASDGTFDVRDLVRFLGEGSPSIRTRNHHLDRGIVLIDPREVTEAEADVIVARLHAFIESR